jgi:alpha-amylase/alpha-mannosidase (GH57 family)
MENKNFITNDKWIENLRINQMDKDYKKLGKEAKKIETDTKKILKKDKSRDKLVEKGKKMKARGC